MHTTIQLPMIKEQLKTALETGDVQALSELIDFYNERTIISRALSFFRIDSTDYKGFADLCITTFFHKKMNNPDVMLELLRLKEVKKHVMANSNWALCCAAIKGYLDVVKELLKIAEVRNATAGNNTALCWAAETGHLDVVKELLKIAAVRENAAAKNNEVMCYAAQAGKLDVVKELLKITAVRENAAANDNQALRWAAKAGKLEVVQELLKIAAVRENAAARSNETLIWAAKAYRLDVVKELLKIAAVRNAAANDYETLRGAAQAGQLDFVKELLKIAAVRENAAANNNEALRWAAMSGKLDIVKELLKIAAVRENAAANDNQALRWAAEAGQLDVVKELLKIPAVINPNNNHYLNTILSSSNSCVIEEVLKRILKKTELKQKIVKLIEENRIDLTKQSDIIVFEVVSNLWPNGKKDASEKIQLLLSKLQPKIESAIQAQKELLNLFIHHLNRYPVIIPDEIQKKIDNYRYNFKEDNTTYISPDIASFLNELKQSYRDKLDRYNEIYVMARRIAQKTLSQSRLNLMLRKHMEKFAKDLLVTSNFQSESEFEAEVEKLAANEADKMGVVIIREILETTPANKEFARSSSNELIIAECKKIFNCAPNQLFEKFKLNYSKLWENRTQCYKSSKFR